MYQKQKQHNRQDTETKQNRSTCVNRYKYNTKIHDSDSYRCVSVDMCIVVVLLLLLPVYLSAYAMYLSIMPCARVMYKRGL
jgi:hypothetical protein